MFISKLSHSIAWGDPAWGALGSPSFRHVIDVTTSMGLPLKLVQNNDVRYELAPLSPCCGDFLFLQAEANELFSFKGRSCIYGGQASILQAWKHNPFRAVSTLTLCHSCHGLVEQDSILHTLIPLYDDDSRDLLENALVSTFSSIEDLFTLQVITSAIYEELVELTNACRNYIFDNVGEPGRLIEQFCENYNRTLADDAVGVC